MAHRWGVGGRPTQPDDPNGRTGTREPTRLDEPNGRTEPNGASEPNGRVDRRGFLRGVGAALAWLSLRPAPSRAAEAAAEIHRDTRNTRFGAVGRALARLGPTPRRAKPYPGLPRVALPPPVSGPGLPLATALARAEPADGFTAEPLSLSEVARLLYYANGVTGEMRWDGGSLPLRAAPSAGALYAGEVYLVAERVEGLPRGVYAYAVAGHALVRIRDGAWLEEVARATEQPHRLRSAAAVVLLTNVFRRYTWRYANRGYRYALIDTGHIDENLRLATASAGHASLGTPRYHDEALEGVLRIDGRQEAVCAVRALGRPGAPAARDGTVPRLVEKGLVGAARRLRAPAERYHERTKLVPTAGEEEPARRVPAAGDHGAEPVTRPRPRAVPPRIDEAPRMTVERAIRRRRSAMRFEPERIARSDLDFLLAAAAGVATPHVGIDLIAHRVAGLPAGLHRLDPESGGPELRRAGELGDALVKVCIGQEKAGEAALAFFMVGRITAAAAAHGERSYRDLLVAAGAIGERLYLAAESLRLAARNLAAFRDDDLNALLDLDGRSEAVLHLTVVGPGD